jgi:hypothetical protein
LLSWLSHSSPFMESKALKPRSQESACGSCRERAEFNRRFRILWIYDEIVMFTLYISKPKNLFLNSSILVIAQSNRACGFQNLRIVSLVAFVSL